VYLEERYLGRLTERVDDGGNYEYSECDSAIWVSHALCEDDSRPVHGPARIHSDNESSMMPVDSVYCVRCLSWPLQAADWPTRHRNYGWPDSAKLDLVVSNGCDFVGVGHRRCRQNECGNSQRQWRLSFSRAEIVLINSWMPVQQIAYHILRDYVKTERLTESVDNSEPAIMSNYHIKTLLLWACELKPRSWWTENNLVRICAELLNILSVWLTDIRCPHYFINNCNLLDTALSDPTVTSKLMSIDETYLLTWLINNYIGRCAQLCPDNVSRYFDDVGTEMKLVKAVTEIARWRVDSSLVGTWSEFNFAEICIQLEVSECSVSARSCIFWMEELRKIDTRFTVYFSAIALLYVAREISRDGFSEKLMDILTTVNGCNFNRCKNEVNTSELVELLQKSAVQHLTTYRQLVARDFGYVAAIDTADFEALYSYKRGDYQRCLQLSTQNVHRSLYAYVVPHVSIIPEFVQLLDDDIVSLTALTLMVNPECRRQPIYTSITQLTLSLYLMTQCQLKLRHPVGSLAQTLDYVKIAQRKESHTLNHLTLQLIERKIHQTIVNVVAPPGFENTYFTFFSDFETNMTYYVFWE